MSMHNVNVDLGLNPEVEIIYEDEHMFAVNKPAGLVVHADGRTVEATLSDWVLESFPFLKDVGGLHTLDSGRYAPRAGILHRLDRETSGVIVIAKNDNAFYFIQRQFLDHSIQKTYRAFVFGIPELKAGVIDFPIGRSRVDFRQWTTGANARGTLRNAVTHYRILGSSTLYSSLELQPETGRTHQLRVHLKAIGHPILCDSRYESPSALGFKRLALHAATITLKLQNGELRTLTAQVPSDFAAALLALAA